MITVQQAVQAVLLVASEACRVGSFCPCGWLSDLYLPCHVWYGATLEAGETGQCRQPFKIWSAVLISLSVACRIRQGRAVAAGIDGGLKPQTRAQLLESAVGRQLKASAGICIEDSWLINAALAVALHLLQLLSSLPHHNSSSSSQGDQMGCQQQKSLLILDCW